MAAATRARDPRSSKLLPLLAAVALPCVVFVAHGSFFSGWLIDDAGISFAYARNLATGHGLVAQPGAEPVEGFTNLLWVLLLAPWISLGASPAPAVKLVSGLLVLGGFVTLAAGARAWFADRWVLATVVGLTTTSLVTGFVAWTLSGLENGLVVPLVAALVVGSTSSSDTGRSGAGLGLVWILLFATRPDSAPLAVVPPVAWALRGHTRAWKAYAGVAGAGLVALTGFRALYFRDVVPNTYYAKGAPGSDLLGTVEWTAATGLLFGLAGAFVLAALIGGVYALLRQALGPMEVSEARASLLTLWLTLGISYLSFEAMPTDWMPGGRFATTLFLLAPLAALGSMRRRVPRLAIAGALLLGSLGYAVAHTPDFAHRPPAPFESVIDLSERLADVGDALGSGSATRVLLPDIGGALWRGRFEVVDLGGLVDRTIGRELHSADPAALHDYLFEERRPDLIWTHGFWRQTARLDSDPRLARDYQSIHSDGVHELFVRKAAATPPDRAALSSAFHGVN